MRPSLTIVPFPVMLTLLILVAAGTGCDEAATGPNVFSTPGFESEHSPFVFYGRVTEASGKPLAGADIHYFGMKRKVSLTSKTVPLREMPLTAFTFNVSKETHITVRILRLGSREVTATLIDSVLRPGIYTVSTNMRTMTNGWYIVQVSGIGIYEEHLTFHFHSDPFALLKTMPLASTDINGRFQLPHRILGLEEDLLGPLLRDNSYYNSYLSDSIGFIIHSAGTYHIVWTAVDKHSNTNATLTFQ